MPLIDKTYFVGEINIPNTGNADVEARLNFFIAKYEDALLRKVLGDALYAAYKTGIAVTPTPDTKWTELRDGKVYTNSNSVSKTWMGFRNATTKQSMIANYVYYWYQRDSVTDTTAIGETSVKADNSSSKESPAVKMARAWNEAAKWIYDLLCFLLSNIETYTEFKQVCVSDIVDEFSSINQFNL
jgi:hypothetical protein